MSISTAENVGVIEEALVKLYRRVKDREIQLSDLTEVLVKDYGERGKGLRQRLFAFTREGQFGMFFDRPNELKAHSSFNVFDLKRWMAIRSCKRLFCWSP